VYLRAIGCARDFARLLFIDNEWIEKGRAFFGCIQTPMEMFAGSRWNWPLAIERIGVFPGEISWRYRWCCPIFHVALLPLVAAVDL